MPKMREQPNPKEWERAHFWCEYLGELVEDDSCEADGPHRQMWIAPVNFEGHEDKPRHKNARKKLGHSETILVKIHPDLLDFVRSESEARYQSQAEFIRSLIIAAKRSVEIGS